MPGGMGGGGIPGGMGGGGMPGGMGGMKGGHRGKRSAKDEEESQKRMERDRLSQSEHAKTEAELDLLNPDLIRIKFEVDGVGSWHSGTVVVLLHRSWSPIGVDHLVDMVQNNVLDNTKFFRYVKDFIVQFGIPSQPSVTRRWLDPIEDDHPTKPVSNRRGTVSFAMKGDKDNSRTTQLFVNLVENGDNLDDKGFTPVGEIIRGMDIIDHLYKRYGERPDQSRLIREGNEYLDADYPLLSMIRYATILNAPKPKLSTNHRKRGQGEGNTGAGMDAGASSTNSQALVLAKASKSAATADDTLSTDIVAQKYRATVVSSKVRLRSGRRESAMGKNGLPSELGELQAGIARPAASPVSSVMIFVGGMFFSAAIFIAYVRFYSKTRRDKRGGGRKKKKRRIAGRWKKERVV